MQTSNHKNKSDQKCIWMLAGVINYKLCDRHFNCENCQFDQVMRGLLPKGYREEDSSKWILNGKNQKRVDSDSTSHLINQYIYALFSECKIYLDRYYYSPYFWFKTEAEHQVLVGIDKLLIKILEPIDNIILPETNILYRKGQLIAWIVRKGKTLPLHSPIEGKVVEINNLFCHRELKQQITNDEYCYKMENEGLKYQVEQVCGNMHGIQCFTEKVYRVRKYLEKAIHEDHPVPLGVTFADGGCIQTCLEKVIGEKAFQLLLKELFVGEPK